jgi:drug/metabolite transporter (DMT)-like permease
MKGSPPRGTAERALKYDALLLLAAFIWGLAFVAQRAGMAHVGPFTFNAIRFALGCLVLLPLGAARRRRLDRQGGDPRSPRAAQVPEHTISRRMLIIGGGLTGIALFLGASLQQIGLVYTTAGKAGRIPPWHGWLGAVFAVIGLYLLSIAGRLTLARGDAFVLAGAFVWAVHVLLIDRFAGGIGPLRLAAVQYVICSLLSLIVALATETITLPGLRGAAIPILYGGLCSVGLAYTLQVIAQRRAPPAHAAIILSLEAVFAALGGWILLSEVLAVRAIVGGGLMLAGAVLSQFGRHPKRPVDDRPIDH